MRLETACQPVFARHETFHPRYGWVKKGQDTAARDPRLFDDDEAVVELGVGKNMVRSIRHWGLAFRVLAPEKQAGSRMPLAVPSAIGHTIFDDRGWDPYCELPGTLWLLHWWLLAPPSIAPVWWLAFNEFAGVEFIDEQLEQFVADRARDWADPHPSAIRKDVSCLLRMYASGHATRATFDDMIDCPFRDLDLIRPSEATKGAFRFLIGPKPTLPPAIAAFACLDFIARADSTARTVTVSGLATEPGAPGRVFKLTEPALIDLLDRAAVDHHDIESTSVAGIPQLVFDDAPDAVATDLLHDHYRSLTDNARFPGHLLVAGRAGDRPAQRAPSLDLSRSAR